MLLLFNPGCLVFNPASFILSITLNRGGGGTKSVIMKHDKSYLLLYVDGLFLSLFFLFLFFFSLFFLYLFYFFLFKFRIILFLSETFISQKRKAQDWSLAQSDYRAMGYSPVEKNPNTGDRGGWHSCFSWKWHFFDRKHHSKVHNSVKTCDILIK